MSVPNNPNNAIANPPQFMIHGEVRRKLKRQVNKDKKRGFSGIELEQLLKVPYSEREKYPPLQEIADRYLPQINEEYHLSDDEDPWDN